MWFHRLSSMWTVCSEYCSQCDSGIGTRWSGHKSRPRTARMPPTRMSVVIRHRRGRSIVGWDYAVCPRPAACGSNGAGDYGAEDFRYSLAVITYVLFLASVDSTRECRKESLAKASRSSLRDAHCAVPWSMPNHGECGGGLALRLGAWTEGGVSRLPSPDSLKRRCMKVETHTLPYAFRQI